jgi:uncharacterized heparinase superfamily protein
VHEFGVSRIQRILQKPPRIILQRMLTEFNAQTDRFRAPHRARVFDANVLIAQTETASLDDLWTQLSRRIYAIPIRPVSPRDYERVCPGDADRIFVAAEAAIEHRVDVLGTGQVALGSPIAWHTDFKTGTCWPMSFMRDINYTNLGCPSDVKVPWEVSRLQWLIPVGQAYLLSGDERYAVACREVLDDWMGSNPYAHGVNWTCTMEAAMRIFTWTWFFHVFCRSQAWSDSAFQSRFLRTLFLHGEFTERYLERSDINGNHFTADAAALVFVGLFFGKGAAATRWAETGWQHLCEELPRQVSADGVDFEASVPYHRLVLELFFLSARFREACGLTVHDAYRERVLAMARFTQAYTRPDGTTPLLGDADDARTLPFGGQPIGDHRYLVGLVGTHWNERGLTATFTGPRAEIFWTLGPHAAAVLRRDRATAPVSSGAFPDGGCFVMRNDRDHVFIDCGPVGQGGRGGHGHNDCLSFEAVIDGVHLVSDCGAYLYTASVVERNNFRSSAYHNTPQIDGGELNRFISRHHLWTLHNDAIPEVRRWEIGPKCDVFVGAHSGYERLTPAVTPVRKIVLDHECHALRIDDTIVGSGEHVVTIPLHLAPGVDVEQLSAKCLLLKAGAKTFLLEWSSETRWDVEIGQGRVSPRYGVTEPVVRLLWRCSAHDASLSMSLSPARIERPRPVSDESLVTVGA